MPYEQYPANEGLQVIPPGEGLEYRYNSTDAAHSYPEVDYRKPSGLDQPPSYQKSDRATITICGLKRRIFWIVLGTVAVVIIAAAVAGGVVASRKNTADNSTLPQSSATSTTASSSSTNNGPITSGVSATSTIATKSTTGTTAQTAYPTTALPLDCPAINGTTHTTTVASTSQSYTFNVFCNVNFAPGLDSGGRNASSVDDCMQSCVDLLQAGGVCAGIVWDSVINLSLSPLRNCFMKSSTSGFVYTGNNEISAAALLVT